MSDEIDTLIAALRRDIPQSLHLSTVALSRGIIRCLLVLWIATLARGSCTFAVDIAIDILFSFVFVVCV